MRFLLCKNTKAPYNLKRISLSWLGRRPLLDPKASIKRTKLVGWRYTDDNGTATEAEGRIVFTGEDILLDGVSIYSETSDEVLARRIGVWLGTGLLQPGYIVVEEADYPGGKVSPENDYDYFFDTWEIVGGLISVNMVKARKWQGYRIRGVRDKDLSDLDVPFLRAVEAGDVAEQQRISGLKQALRDCPATVDLESATTPEELCKMWPAILGEQPRFLSVPHPKKVVVA